MARLPKVKLRAITVFPTNVEGGNAVTVTKANGLFRIDLDVSDVVVSAVPAADEATTYAISWGGVTDDNPDGSFQLVPYTGLQGASEDLTSLSELGTTGLVTRIAHADYVTRTVTAGTGIGVTDGDGVAGNPTVAITDVELLALAGVTSAADRLFYFTGSGTGSLATFTSFGRSLVDDADAATAQATLGLVIGTNVQAFDADLAALAANSTDGLWAHTGAGTGAARTLTAPAAGLSITNPAGIAGNPTFALANDLSALEGLGSTGIAVRTGTDAWAQRTLTGPAAGISVSNGDGVSGNPTLALANDLAALEALSGTNTIYYRSASDTWTAVTVGTGLAFAGGTLSASGGSGGSVGSPQGRLTLVTATPVMTTTQSAKTTIYYTPYVGNQIPIYDGSTMTATTFAELSVATTDTTKSPAAIGASKVNDWFVWNDAGTMRIGHGPDWTSDTVRSAGTALVMVNGIYLNNASITNGPAASRGTYVGTTRSNASSQLDWIYAGSGVAAFFNVWNMYNRVTVGSIGNEGTGSWTYTSSTVRGINNTAIARVSFVRGMDEDSISMAGSIFIDTNTSTTMQCGLALDSTSAHTRQMQATAPGVAGIGNVQYGGLPGLGFHFMQQTENGNNVNPSTAYGGATLSSLRFEGRF